MANYSSLRAAINAVIYTNIKRAITGDVLNNKMNEMIDALGAGYQYMGKASPSTNPGMPDSNVVYLATTAGTYLNFGGLPLDSGKIAFFRWNGTWQKDEVSVQAELTIDTQPTVGSDNPVSSGGVHTALQDKQDTIAEVEVTVDNQIGTPSGTASVSGNKLSIYLSRIKGATGAKGETGETGAPGPRGPQGNPGSSQEYPFELENDPSVGGTDKAATAESVKTVYEDTVQLDLDIHGREDTAIDPTSFEQLKGHLGTSSAWGTSVNSRHIYIPCSPGDVFVLTADPDTGTNYAFMPDAPDWVSGGAVTTLGGRIAVAAGNTATAIAPSGANYLYVQTRTSGQVDCTPAAIILKAAPGIDQSIMSLNTKASKAEKGIKELNLFDENILNIQYSVLANKTGYAGNTMGHFMHGIRKGYNALKADMRLTSDGYIILCHDAGYTLNSSGKITGYDASSANTTPIHDMTLAEIKALEFASPDPSGNYYHPVELSEFIYLCKYYGIIPFITLREDAYRQETSTAMAAILKKYGMESRALINLYMSPANLTDTTAILDETAPNVKRCYTMLEGWSMSIANLTHGLNCGCQYICTFSSHQGDITDELCVFMANNNARLLSIIHSEEEYNSTTENGYVGFQSYADYAPVRTLASLSLELAESV